MAKKLPSLERHAADRAAPAPRKPQETPSVRRTKPVAKPAKARAQARKTEARTKVPDPASATARPDEAPRHTRIVGAKEIVERYTAWAAIGDVLPFPLLDAAIISALNVRMVSELSQHYGMADHERRGRTIVFALLGSLGFAAVSYSVARLAIRSIPVFGWTVGMAATAGVAAAATQAIGGVLVQHFEAGGTLLDFDPEAMRDHFRAEFTAERRRSGG